MYGNEMTDLKSGPDPGPPVVALETPMCHLNVPRNVCHLIVTSYTNMCFQRMKTCLGILAPSRRLGHLFLRALQGDGGEAPPEVEV